MKLSILYVFYLSLALSPLSAGERREETPDAPKICLTMIVKNESRVIERCLNSVKDLIDCLSICDTGSTDDTVAIIEEYMKKEKIRGEVHHHEWKNFGHNRTLSARAARETLKELAIDPSNTYLLLLDADMLLVREPGFDKSGLIDDAYMLNQTSNTISYSNTRLIRASLPWECIGATHEYWGCKGVHQRGTMKTLWIDDREDGGCKADKFQRDIALLTAGLQEEPENERYYFYLAQSYKCLEEYEKAIEWYQKRIDKGGWREEVWYSKYMMAECLAATGRWDEALYHYLEAYQALPERAEPLYSVARHYRERGAHYLGYLFAAQAKKIPYPESHLLFVEYPIYDYLIDEEIAISAFYTPYKDEGEAAINRLLISKKYPHNRKSWAYQTLLFYVKNIPISSAKPLDIEPPPIGNGVEDFYRPTNPSIVKTPEGYELICRCVNYLQQGAVHFPTIDPNDPTIRTRNLYLCYDRNFAKRSQQEILEHPSIADLCGSVKGFEDCRLIIHGSRRYFTAAVRQDEPFAISQYLCELDSPSDEPYLRTLSAKPLHLPNMQSVEKNWLPFIENDRLYFTYYYHPIALYSADTDTRECTHLLSHSSDYDLSYLRGSAPPIPFEGGYLLLVHEVLFTDQRFYLHRLLQLDREFQLQALSDPFTFFHKGIEFCVGMTTDHEEKQLIFAVGYEDREAHLVFVEMDTIKRMLTPVRRSPLNPSALPLSIAKQKI